MFINLALKAGARFVVTLNVDLKAYCEAYVALGTSKKHLEQLLADRKANKRAVSDDEVEAASSNIAKAQTLFSELRKKCREYFTPWGGELISVDIQKLLRSQCRSDDKLDRELYEALSATGTERTPPLAIECFNLSFVELLKNSVDAMLMNYLKGTRATTLQMEIALSMEGSKISIAIRDNAGGFPADYLSDFSKIVDAQDDTPEAERMGCHHKLAFADYCFGGHGIGLLRLARYLLQGKLLGARGEARPIYLIEKGATALSVGNSAETKGAEIILITPMKPFPSFVLSAEITSRPLSPIDLFVKEFEPSSPVERKSSFANAAKFVLFNPLKSVELAKPKLTIRIPE